mmetsp:Transcript_6949/g.13576  ORF Transcript_6949/g.13576 Transcript_6949/m.13576 type:complete len:91 (-) Transcript_6949:533-805(-)
MSYEGLKSLFFDNSAKASEEDYNLVPSGNAENEEARRSSCSSRFQGKRSVRFSQMSHSGNVSRSSAMKAGSSGEEKCEERSLPPSSHSSP